MNEDEYQRSLPGAQLDTHEAAKKRLAEALKGCREAHEQCELTRGYINHLGAAAAQSVASKNRCIASKNRCIASQSRCVASRKPLRSGQNRRINVRKAMTATMKVGSTALLLAATVAAGHVGAQTRAALPPLPSGCQRSLPAPAAEPPARSLPVVVLFEMCAGDDDRSVRTPVEEYVKQIRVMSSVSIPSRGQWVPFTADVERTVEADLERLRSQGYVASATSEVKDYVFPNGVVGKVITYKVTERPVAR